MVILSFATMIFKSLAVSVRCGKLFVGVGKTILSDNLTLNRFLRVRSCNILWQKSPSTQGLERMFCTAGKEADKYSLEDLLTDPAEVADECTEPSEEEEGLAKEELFQEISGGDPVKLKKLRLLEFELAVLREAENKVPDKLKRSDWLELVSTDSPTRRKKLLAYYRLNELKTLSNEVKKEGRRKLYEMTREEEGFHYYGLSGHTMFMRIYDRSLNRLMTLRTEKSNFQVLLDCSYQEFMNPILLKNCATQIFYCYSLSKLHRYPCKIKLCNFDKNDTLGKMLPKYYCGVYDMHDEDIHLESYLDMYPKEKLVYLTPHAGEDIKFNFDDIYIIGAFVDKGTGVKASLAKAKKYNLRMGRLPLDQYLNWKSGTKSLALNIVLAILLDMCYYNDWNRALKNIPTRFLTEREVKEYSKKKRQKLIY